MDVNHKGIFTDAREALGAWSGMRGAVTLQRRYNGFQTRGPALRFVGLGGAGIGLPVAYYPRMRGPYTEVVHGATTWEAMAKILDEVSGTMVHTLRNKKEEGNFLGGGAVLLPPLYPKGVRDEMVAELRNSAEEAEAARVNGARTVTAPIHSGGGVGESRVVQRQGVVTTERQPTTSASLKVSVSVRRSVERPRKYQSAEQYRSGPAE